MRWLLLDEILEIKKGILVRASSRIPSGDEVSPEILMLEMMAQTAGILQGAENEFKDNVVFAKIEKAEFFQAGNPGSRIDIQAACQELRAEGSWMDTQVTDAREGCVRARARLMLITAGNLIPGISHSITFHPAFMSHFKVLEKIK